MFCLPKRVSFRYLTSDGMESPFIFPFDRKWFYVLSDRGASISLD